MKERNINSSLLLLRWVDWILTGVGENLQHVRSCNVFGKLFGLRRSYYIGKQKEIYYNFIYLLHVNFNLPRVMWSPFLQVIVKILLWGGPDTSAQS